MWFLHRRLDSFIMMGQLRVITGIQQLTNFIQTGELGFRQPGLCKKQHDGL